MNIIEVRPMNIIGVRPIQRGEYFTLDGYNIRDLEKVRCIYYEIPSFLWANQFWLI